MWVHMQFAVFVCLSGVDAKIAEFVCRKLQAFCRYFNVKHVVLSIMWWLLSESPRNSNDKAKHSKNCCSVYFASEIILYIVLILSGKWEFLCQKAHPSLSLVYWAGRIQTGALLFHCGFLSCLLHNCTSSLSSLLATFVANICYNDLYNGDFIQNISSGSNPK